MKKIFLFAAMAAVVNFSMTSCANDESETVANENTKNAISFNVLSGKGLATRGTEVSSLNADGNSFMVWGYYATTATTPGALYLPEDGTATTGQVVNYTTAWDYAPHMFWPAVDQKLNFQAVSPYNYGTNLTSTPPATGDDAGIAKVAQTVTVPTANASQADLVFGQAVNQDYTATAQTATLTFNHAMSQILFTAINQNEDYTATIKDVSVCNVKNKGDVGFLGTVTGQARALSFANLQNDGAASTSHYVIGQAYDTGETFTTVTASVAGGDDPVMLTAMDGDTPTGSLMMLPQVFTDENSDDANDVSAANGGANDKWLPAGLDAANGTDIATADTDRKSYIKVVCKLQDDKGQYLLGTASSFGTIYIPFQANWEQGKKYTYNLIFGTGGGGFDEDGTPLLNYIKFDTTVSDWTNVTPAINVSF